MSSHKRLFHIHVYRVTEKAEFEISASSEQEALEKALTFTDAEETKWTGPDCAFIGMAYPMISEAKAAKLKTLA